MAIEQNGHKCFFDANALYCEEEEAKWGSDLEEEYDTQITTNHTLSPHILTDQDFIWDDEELQTLFIKEKETCFKSNPINFSLSRKEAVEWILKITSHYGFSSLTAILAVNYLDRFLSSLSLPKDKPWMIHLTSITCLSLAAKVEETQVPLLLDLQVEGTEYVFEAKTIQKMELLVLSGLRWRMNPVTPLSFLDHIIRRLGLNGFILWEFLKSCENLLLSVISDPRFTVYLPSVLATATMLHVIHLAEKCCNGVDYENQLLDVLKISKEEVDECCDLITEVLSNTGFHYKNGCLKRQFCEDSDSPDGVMDVFCSSTHQYQYQQQPIFKKRRVGEQQMRLASMSRVFVEPVGSPH